MTTSPQEQALFELYEIIRRIVSIDSQTDVNEILKQIIDSAGRVLNADSVVLHMLHTDEQSSNNKFEPSSLSSKSLIYQLLDLTKPNTMVVEDLPSLEDSFAQREKIKSIAAVRLTVGDEIVGTISVTYRTPQHFTEEQIRLITLFADQAALAIKHIRLMQEGGARKDRKYHSCFVSYSSKDEAIVQKLYKDLTAKNVRCWFAPADMKIGDKIRTKIDDVINQHDKLLVILSESSINSQWVEQEVETALAKERKKKLTMLFPIRLDDKVMKARSGWAKYIRNTRNIGDFSNWTQEDAYLESFNRLLHDLEKES